MLQNQMRCQIKAESLLFPTMYKSKTVTFPTCSGFCGSGSHIKPVKYSLKMQASCWNNNLFNMVNKFWNTEISWTIFLFLFTLVQVQWMTDFAVSSDQSSTWLFIHPNLRPPLISSSIFWLESLKCNFINIKVFPVLKLLSLCKIYKIMLR